MDILKSISNQLKDAMKAKDNTRLQVIRSIKGELLKLQTSGKNNELDETALVKIVKTLIKEKNESIEHAQKAQRKDIIEEETQTLNILKTFLPEQFTENELTQIVQQAIDKAQATSPQDMGKVMKEVRQLITESSKDADMNIVSQLVKKSLND